MAWRPYSLGDVCDVIAGQSPDGAHYNDRGEGLPFYQGKKEFGERDIEPPRVWTTLTTKEADAGDILMSVRAPVGPINYAIEKCCIGRGLAALRAKPGVDQEFLFYLLLSKQPEIAGSEGAVFPSISKKQIESIRVSIPSLSEQKRIVAILDEAFEGIRIATANAEKNLANARELFRLYLRAAFEGRVNSTWVKVRLRDVGTVLSGSGFPTRFQGHKDHELPFYKVSDMNLPGNDREMIAHNNSVTREIQRELGASIFPRGSVIFPKIGGAIATNKKRVASRDCCVDNNVMGVSPITNKIDSEFLYYFFLAHDLAEFANDAHLPSIRKTVVEDWPLAMPETLDEQRLVVTRLRAMSEETERLASSYRERLEALHTLKQSILSRAFSGQLTATKGLAA